MIQKECPLCLSDERESTLVASELVQGTREKFTYAICANCKSVYLTEVPDDMRKYYANYYSFQDNNDSILLNQKTGLKLAVKKLFRTMVRVSITSRFVPRSIFRNPPSWALKFISPNLQALRFLSPNIKSHILDVGSGNGEFVTFLYKHGYLNIRGIDPFILNESAYVSRRDIYDEAGKFDVIIMNHSLEHMIEPLKVLKKCKELLNKNGEIIVHLPSADSVEFKKYKEHWWGLHAPRHFFLPTVIGFSNAAKSAGLEVREIISTSRYDHYLYSEDYSKDIADYDEKSVRRIGASIETRKRAHERLAQAGAINGADWVAYYLRMSD